MKKKSLSSPKGFWKRLFSRGSSQNNTPENEDIPTPDSLEREWEKAIIKFRNFHLTKNMKTGEEIAKKDYKVKKTSDTIYRLEGKNYQIILVTGNSLGEKDSKVTGILQITESDLNRALQREHSGLESFLELWKLEITEGNLTKNPEGKERNWKRILGWDRFWKEQLLIRLRPDTVSLLMVGLGEDFKNFVLDIATTKQKKIYQDELFYLNRGKNSADWNPYSRNKTLVEPDLAIKDLEKVIRLIEDKQNKESQK